MTVNKDKTGQTAQHSTGQERDKKIHPLPNKGLCNNKRFLNSLKICYIFRQGFAPLQFHSHIFFFCYFLLKIYARLLFSFRFLSSSLNIFKLCVRTTPQEIMMSSICETTFFVVLWLLVTISGFRLCLSCLGWSCLRKSLTTFLKFWLCCQKEFIQLHKRYRNDEVGYCWRNTKQNFSIFISCCFEFVFFFVCYICNNNNTDLRAYNLVYVHAFVIIFKNVYIEILLRNSMQVKELKIHSEKLQKVLEYITKFKIM